MPELLSTRLAAVTVDGPTTETPMGRAIYLSDLVTAIEEKVEARGISYRTAAAELDVSPQRLSQWRRGARIDWSAPLQQRIAAFLAVSPLEVLEMDGLDVSTDPVPAANLTSVGTTNPGSVWSSHYHPSRGDAGRFRRGRRTHPVRGAVATYGRRGGDRPWVTGDACRGSTSICTATA